MTVILYTTHCPKCVILEKKLKDKNIDYIVVEEKSEIMKLGYMTVPLLKVDEQIMQYSEANNWINDYKGEQEC